ncbi:acetylxylan esterase [Vagococcus sp. PNs007]|uniref:Acetylxylan esterase n=1 Tax=Vagococcus proximus TaxID=2991417 RepID=A0ABT5X2T0_9ENTE|nr:acetylxylan esterase [Vagococcus proximus]MDF0480214.1 acetylxylan esterase [Vagococcus proximus]
MIETMPQLEMEGYKGQDTIPQNFSFFWDDVVSAINQYELSYKLVPKPLGFDFVDCYELFFNALDGSEIYAKVSFPKKEKCPIIFKFHGYQGQSSDWSESFKYIAAGIGVVMMDVRGQSGKSTDHSIHSGNTVKGHIIRGVQDGPDNLFYKNVYEDSLILMRIISQLPQVDETNLMTLGDSQGGALALVSAALNPEIKRVFSVYPFLSDFRRVLQLNYDTEAYDELHRYFKFSDPLYETESIFFETLGYIDVKNFASRIRGEITMVCGLQDDVCPPSTQYAIYNRLRCKKKLYILPEYGHESLNVKIPDLIFNWAVNKDKLNEEEVK